MSESITSAHEWSEEILREIFRHTPVGVALTDLHGTILEINDALAALIGYPRAQIVGHNAVSFLHPEDVAQSGNLLSDLRHGDTGSRRVVGRIRTRSGRYVWVTITVSVVQSRADEPSFGVAFIEDITERREMERVLHETATLYRQVVRDQTEMIVRWKPDGTRTFVNDAYTRYFGLRESDVIGTSFMPLIVQEDRAAIDEKIRQLTPESPVRSGLHRVIVADGSVRWNEWTDRAIFDDQGRITMLQSVGRDVTDRMNASDALRISEARYRALFEELPIAAWEVDWSDLIAAVRVIGARSTEELVAAHLADPTLFSRLVGKVHVLAVNSAACALAEVEDLENFERWRAEVYVDEHEMLVRAVGPLIFDGADTRAVALSVKTAKGNHRDVLWHWAHVRENDAAWRFIVVVLDVTHQKRNEREVIEKQDRLDQAEAIAKLGHWEFDAETGQISGSGAYWQIYDGTPGGAVTRPLIETIAQIHPEDRVPVEAALAKLRGIEPATAPLQPGDWQYRIIRPDGETRWVRSMSQVKPRPGRLPLIFGVDQDVTDAKAAEDALRRSEQMYRDLFHNLPVAVWESDWTEVLAALAREGITTPDAFLDAIEKDPQRFGGFLGKRRLVEANPQALQLLDVKNVDDLARATFPPRVAPDQVASFRRTLAYAVFGQTPKTSFDLQIARANGTSVDVDAFLSASEAAPGHLINMAVDVSDRKAVERELRSSQLQLERAQAIAHLGSWELSVERDELVGSREYWNMIDGAPDGPRARKLSEMLERVHPDDRDRVRDAIKRAASRYQDKATDEVTIEFRFIRPDGSLRIAFAQGLFSATASGEVRGYGIQQDITDLKRAEESARQQREELMRADRMISLGILVSGVAHEINNPNQFITLNAPFLRDTWKDIAPIIESHARANRGFRVNGMPWSEMKDEIPAIISEIDRGAERIRSIVSELKAFGRDPGAAELRPASLNEIIESSLRLMATHIRRATSDFTTDLASDLPHVLANPHRLEQVVINLVMNSCQALERPDASIRVETSYDAKSKRVLMRVIDEGCGIPADNLRNIRDPFFTTKRAEGGMGLGLAVSDRIVQEHNGSLSFESEPGHGTTATLSLPAVLAEEPAS